MAKFERYDRAPLGPSITLIAGNTLFFKVHGLGSNRKHLILQSKDRRVKVIPIKVDHRHISQSLKLEIQQDKCITCSSVVYIHAYIADSKPHTRGPHTRNLIVIIEPRLELPPADSEAGILARMLIVENAGPGHPEFVSQTEVLVTMQWMHHVLINRLKLGAQHFAAGRQANTLTALIKAPNQIEGFENYPRIAKAQNDVLLDMIKIANDGSDKRYEKYRTYIQNAIAVAQGLKPGIDPCPDGLYAWRTTESAHPGANFVHFQTKGGQDFYTLTQKFKNQHLQKEPAKR